MRTGIAALGQPIHPIGIELSRERRALAGLEVETLSSRDRNSPAPGVGD